ncbi:MAG: hypothetical protein ACO1NX_07950 [Chitinophagaceae bacterium]
MKKFLIALTIACSVFTMSAIASDVKVSAKVLAAFENTFHKATDVKWTQVKSLYQASFEMEDESYAAYFDVDGNMVVVARFITADQLPKQLEKSLKEEVAGGQVSYLFELTDEEGTHYYATIEKEGKKSMLQSMGIKKWVPYNKVKI